LIPLRRRGGFFTQVAGTAGGRNVKKIKNQKAKIQIAEPLRGSIFD
jgi:hypothetical protein